MHLKVFPSSSLAETFFDPNVTQLPAVIGHPNLFGSRPFLPAVPLLYSRCRGDSAVLFLLFSRMEICLWPRGDYIFEHLLPKCSSLPDLDVILHLIQELTPLRPYEAIELVGHRLLGKRRFSSDTWYSSCRYLDIPWDTASLVYKNCTSASGQPRAAELCLDLLLLSLKPKVGDRYYSRDDQIAEFFHNNISNHKFL